MPLLKTVFERKYRLITHRNYESGYYHCTKILETNNLEEGKINIGS